MRLSFPRRFDQFFPLLLPVLAVVAALAVGAIFLLVLGADVGTVYGKLITGAVGNTYSQTQTIGKAVPLLLVALGVCIAFRGNVLNIRVEGQVIVVAFGTTSFALAYPNLPGPLLTILSLLAVVLSGAVLAGFSA